MGPSARAEVLRVLYCSACLRRLQAGSRRPAGAVPQAPSARRRREIFRGGAGGGRFGGQRGGQGRKMAVCGTSWDTEISSRRVDRVPCWGVNSAVFGVQWGAFRLAGAPDLQVDAAQWQPRRLWLRPSTRRPAASASRSRIRLRSRRSTCSKFASRCAV